MINGRNSICEHTPLKLLSISYWADFPLAPEATQDPVVLRASHRQRALRLLSICRVLDEGGRPEKFDWGLIDAIAGHFMAGVQDVELLKLILAFNPNLEFESEYIRRKWVQWSDEIEGSPSMLAAAEMNATAISVLVSQRSILPPRVFGSMVGSLSGRLEKNSSAPTRYCVDLLHQEMADGREALPGSFCQAIRAVLQVCETPDRNLLILSWMQEAMNTRRPPIGGMSIRRVVDYLWSFADNDFATQISAGLISDFKNSFGSGSVGELINNFPKCAAEFSYRPVVEHIYKNSWVVKTKSANNDDNSPDQSADAEMLLCIGFNASVGFMWAVESICLADFIEVIDWLSANGCSMNDFRTADSKSILVCMAQSLLAGFDSTKSSSTVALSAMLYMVENGCDPHVCSDDGTDVLKALAKPEWQQQWSDMLLAHEARKKADAVLH